MNNKEAKSPALPAGRQKLKAKTIIVFVIIILALLLGLLLFFSPKKAVGNLDVFAQCLAQKQITMYGADWCPHCQNEKKAFGESFRFVPYVECPDNPQLCIQKGIEGYPTWILPDGKKLIGEQGLQKLSQESGCTLN